MKAYPPNFVQRWIDGPRVPVSALRKGQMFLSATGGEYAFGHEHNGCCFVKRPDGSGECFAGCADVVLIGGES